MCRHLGYLGPPVAVGEIVTRGAYSLYEQSWAPQDMRGGGRVNADGFGVAWWRDAAATGYRNSVPIWTDPAVIEVLPQLTATAVLAAVRSAGVGMPIERAACAPFVDGRWAFSHNGRIPRWRTAVPAVTEAPAWELESATDSAAVWLALRHALRRAPADISPGRTLATLLTDLLTQAPDARANLLLCDGRTLWATTCTHSLSVLVGGSVAVVASEPYDDDPRWQSIPDLHLVTARPGMLTVEPLEERLT